MHDLPMGFHEPVADAQRVFRAALRALSCPGEPVECAGRVPSVPGLMPATVALLLALTDHETPVWWNQPGPSRWLRFHTGATTAGVPSQARFAVASEAADARHADPDPRLHTLLDTLNAGTDETPEQSATLFIELPSFTGGPATEWSGPGLREATAVHLAAVSPDFWDRWEDNHARFPRGVDVVFVNGTHIVGLPRTTRVRTNLNKLAGG